VVPALRGRGYARRFLADTLALAADAGAATVELEVLRHNPAAIRLYERAGFGTVDELILWTRAPLAAGKDLFGVRTGADADDGDGARDYAAAEIARVARPPASWQREPLSVAAASPLEAVSIGAPAAPAAYAFVRRAGARSGVLDAGARDAASAAALLAALDARVSAALLLLNEPPRGPLHAALAAHPAWSELARQRRMVVRLR
jgi:hypothetical protein